MDSLQNTSQCANCGRSVDQVPLVILATRDGSAHICPQCLPTLIHKPHLLAGKVAGVESLQAQQGH